MVIRKLREGAYWLYVVGSIVPKIGGPAFEPLADFPTLTQAAAYLNYLNGGEGRPL